MHVHAPSADQAILLREIIVELEVEKLLLPGRDGFARFPERVVFVAAPPMVPTVLPSRPDEHLCAGALRRRSLRTDDRDERHAVTTRERFGSRSQDLFVQTSTSILAFCFKDWMKASAFFCFCCSARKSLIRTLT